MVRRVAPGTAVTVEPGGQIELSGPVRPGQLPERLAISGPRP
jgi:hypothetical protein